MPWVITKDYIETGCEGVKSKQEFKQGVGKIPFRLYDDDETLYYEGFISENDQTEEEVFAPLDWAMGNAGCTYMKLFEKGKWSIL